MVTRPIDVLIFHHRDDGSVAERLRSEFYSGSLSSGTSSASERLGVSLGEFEGDLARVAPDEDTARAIVVVVGPAVVRGLQSSLDVIARRQRVYFLLVLGPEPYDLDRLPQDRTFDTDRVSELAERVVRDLESDASQSSSNAPASKTARSSSASSKSARPSSSDEESGPSETLDPDIFGALDGSSRAVLAQAARLAGLGRARRIHMDHLFVALYRVPDPPTQRFFSEEGVTSEELEERVKVSERVLVDPPLILDDLVQSPAVSSHVALAFKAARDIASSSRVRDGEEGWIESRHLLYGALSMDRCSLVKALRRDGRLDPGRIDLSASEAVDPATHAAEAVNLEAAIAGFASDDAKGPDLLDIRREVDALGKVIAARDVAPPLAIGLFGDWGTGKTFFMKRLQRRIRAIAEAETKRTEGEQVYCREIVQLEFNAWTYIDENLWASLASAIFDGLDASLTRRDKDSDALRKDPEKLRTDEFARAKILTDRAAAQHDLDTAQQAKAEADGHVNATETRLRNLAAGSISPAEIIAGAWTTAMSDEATKNTASEATTAIEDAASKLHLDTATITRDLRGPGSVRSRLTVTLRAQFHGWKSWLPIAAVAFVIVAVVAALAPALATLLVSVGGVAVVGAFLVATQSVWGTLGKARDAYLTIVERDRKELERERNAALDRAAKAQAEIDTARKQVLQAESSLEGLRPSRQLANFVSGRHASADYRGRLGVVSQAREDFEQLTQLMADGGRDRGTTQGPFPPAVDRIILYIDDLDRCREKEVVDVLQAVHLLLAFPLFVVVVAVDPRWLVHSLRVQSRVLQGQGAAGQNDGETEADEATEWQSTPLNYLEKIFQVPFAIRPMGETGFKAMIDNLVGAADKVSQTQTHVGVATEPDNVGTPKSPPGDGTAHDMPDPGTPGGEPAEPTDLVPAGQGKPAVTPEIDKPGPTPDHRPAESDDEEEAQIPVEMKGGFLQISDPEREFMGWLHPLVRTPRAAKRFVNVYRILKASIEPARRSELDQADEHRAVLTLLAMLTSHPTETTKLLQDLVDDKPTTDWWSFFRTVRDQAVSEALEEKRAAALASGRPEPGPNDEDDDGWSSLSDKLGQVQTRWPDAPAAPFVRWAREVSRFSFESSRVVLTPATEVTVAPAEETTAVPA